LSFYPFSFFLYKIGEQEGGTGVCVGTVGRGRWWGNWVQIYVNTKMVLVETIPGMGG
jgi:hypothetical protein